MDLEGEDLKLGIVEVPRVNSEINSKTGHLTLQGARGGSRGRAQQRRQAHAAQWASVRFGTGPGRQRKMHSGHERVRIATCCTGVTRAASASASRCP